MAKERTEKAIMDTFLLLLNQNPLDKITVKDIVSACGISRNTFYYHYQDIYDLLRATFAAVVDRVLQENVTTWQESLRSCTSFALENRRAVYHVYRSAYREDLERSLYRVSEERMERLIRHLTAGMTVSEEAPTVEKPLTGFFDKFLQSAARIIRAPVAHEFYTPHPEKYFLSGTRPDRK